MCYVDVPHRHFLVSSNTEEEEVLCCTQNAYTERPIAPLVKEENPLPNSDRGRQTYRHTDMKEML
jgi:hypothetical protein